MSSILLTGPAVEPLSLEETKTFLRVENNDDDPLITALITAARMHIETTIQVPSPMRLLQPRARSTLRS